METKTSPEQKLAKKMKKFAERQMKEGSKEGAFKALMDKYYKKKYWLTFDRACAKLPQIWEHGNDFIEYRFNNMTQ